MANKVIKVPVKDIDGLSEAGGYSFRYRISSKDGNRKSEWSDIININYQTDIAYGHIYSFYERLGFGRANLESETTKVNPHPTNPYDPLYVFTNLAPYGYNIASSISLSEDNEGILNYTWDSLERHGDYANQKFDVYLSFRSAADGWSEWSFAGTTTSNTFSFASPLQGQYVQAAVFLSSFPKLNDIYHNETNFISISNQFNVYRDAGPANLGTRTAKATGTKATARITSLAENFPSAGWSGRRVYADSSATGGDRNAFGEAKVVVVRKVSDTEIEVESNVNFAADITIHNVTLV
jgi:hypothetical protein